MLVFMLGLVAGYKRIILQLFCKCKSIPNGKFRNI